MIYSEDINKVCGLCKRAHRMGSEDEMHCEIKRQNVSALGEACPKFQYDIMKRRVRRRKKLKSYFNPEDFQI